MSLRWLAVATAVCVGVGGCAPGFTEKAKNGIIFYCPGAGNIDFGDAGIREGLKQAGYEGQVASLTWTFSFNPALDQALRINARLGATRLAEVIQDYIDQYPDGQVNVIGLSAGTGVAIWALEDLKGGYQVDNVILLSSSLSHDYDVSKALRRVTGRIYNYYSSEDAVLALPMKVFGTIDGQLGGKDGAGAVGLHSPSGGGRVVNIAWRPEFRKYGYYGGHTDSTSPRFVRTVLSAHILSGRSASRLDTGSATRLATDLPAGRRN